MRNIVNLKMPVKKPSKMQWRKWEGMLVHSVKGKRRRRQSNLLRTEMAHPFVPVNQNLVLVGQIRNGPGFEFFGRSWSVCPHAGRSPSAPRLAPDCRHAFAGIVAPDDVPVTRRVMVRGEPEHGFERDVPVEAPIVSEDKLIEIRVDVLAA